LHLYYVVYFVLIDHLCLFGWQPDVFTTKVKLRRVAS